MKENGRPKAIPGDTKLAQFTFNVGLLKWLRKKADAEDTIPSMIIHRALERERKEGSA